MPLEKMISSLVALKRKSKTICGKQMAAMILIRINLNEAGRGGISTPGKNERSG
jgi:hypothetical protein